jgi:hypothetical protein
LALAAGKDQDCLRVALRAAFVLEPLDQALAAPGMVEKIRELGGGWREKPIPAPGRDELVALATS